MALDLVTRLTLDTQQYDKNLQKSKESLESFRKKQNSVGNSTNIFANGLSKSIGGLVGSIGKLVPAFTAASVGFEAFNRHLKMNEYALDSFNKMSEQAQAAIDDLANSIMSLNTISLGNLVGNFKEMLRVQGELYDAKDALGTFRTVTRHEFVDYTAKRTDALVNYREAKSDGDKEGMAKWAAEYKKWTNELIKLAKEEQKYLRGVIQKEAAKINAVAKTNLSVEQIMEINRNFATYDDFLAKNMSIRYTKGLNSTYEGSVRKVLEDSFTRWSQKTDKLAVRREKELFNQQLKRMGSSLNVDELYAVSRLRGVNEDELLKPLYEAIENNEALALNIANYQKEQQRALKDESSVAKSTTKAVQKQEKTTDEFQDAIDRFKTTASVLKEQKESGVISDAEYRESFQSALSNMVKTLMSADVWNKLTDNQKEYVAKMSSLLTEMNDIDKALLDYNSKSKTDYSNLKKSDERRASIMTVKILEDIYRSKDPKSTFYGSYIEETRSNEGVRSEIEKNIGLELAVRLIKDKNIDFGKLGVSVDEIQQGLGKAFLNGEIDKPLFKMNKDAWEPIKDYLIGFINNERTLDISKEAPKYVSYYQTLTDTLESLFMKSNPGATNRDFLEFLSSYHKVLIEDLTDKQKELDEERNKIDADLSNLTELQNKYNEAVKKLQTTEDEEEKKLLQNTIASLGDKMDVMKTTIAELQKKKKENASNSEDNNTTLLYLQEQSIDTQKNLGDLKELDARIKKWEELASAAYETANALGTLSNAFAEAGNQSAASTLNIIGGLAQMIGVVGEAIGKILGLMTANNAKSASELPFPANLAAIGVAVGASASVASTVMSMSRRKYAQGGIVQGIGSSFSDQIPISVSNGEMILNKGQQRNLFNLLDRGVGVSSVSSGDVTFRIKGNVMEGTLKNHNNQMKKIL